MFSRKKVVEKIESMNMSRANKELLILLVSIIIGGIVNLLLFGVFTMISSVPNLEFRGGDIDAFLLRYQIIFSLVFYIGLKKTHIKFIN